MSIDIERYRDRVRSRREILGGDTYAHSSKWVRVEFGVKVTAEDLEKLLDVYEREAALKQALTEALGMLRTISMFLPEADMVATKVRVWGELLKP